MIGFNEYIVEKEIIDNFETRVAALAIYGACSETLNESDSILESSKILNSLGITTSRENSILTYLGKFASGTGIVFMSILKGDYDKAKLQLKKINKEEVIDFVLKLDAGTIGIIDIPLDKIRSWTGWDIKANVKNKLKQVTDLAVDLKDTVINVKQKVSAFFGDNTLSDVATDILDSFWNSLSLLVNATSKIKDKKPSKVEELEITDEGLLIAIFNLKGTIPILKNKNVNMIYNEEFERDEFVIQTNMNKNKIKRELNSVLYNMIGDSPMNINRTIKVKDKFVSSINIYDNNMKFVTEIYFGRNPITYITLDDEYQSRN